MADDVNLTIVTFLFDTTGPAASDRLLSVLAKYVVVSRQQPGCRNIDLCMSTTTPNRFVVIQKWESPEAQRAHFDSPEMVEMAQSCEGLLADKPEIDLLDGLSAYDLE
jgi:quinol monooxygenase YgiN